MNLAHVELAATRAKTRLPPAVDTCSFYHAIRAFFHEMDQQTSPLSPWRYLWKAAAGAMTKLINSACDQPNMADFI